MKNYFEVLQLPENSDRDEIQAAYRRLAKQYHPDVNHSPDAHQKFCEISEAYEFLMNHWPRVVAESQGVYGKRTGYEAYETTQEYERFRREAKEEAQKQSRMRYEKFRKQHEAFQESGINDIALLFMVFMRLISIVLFCVLLLLPVLLSILSHWALIFLAIFMWPVGGFIGWYIKDNRKGYLVPGRLYYSPERIRHMFSDTHPTAQPCFYCPSRTANSRPYKIDLYRLKDVKYSSVGFRQHQVNYINDSTVVIIPRSHKAFIIHSMGIFIKITSLIFCLLMFPVSSIIWRFIMGIITGAMINICLLMISGTRSNVSFLFSWGAVLRAIVWTSAIVIVSRFSFKPFDIETTDYIYFVVTLAVIFDSFLMQLLNFVFGKYSSRIIFAQHPDVKNKINEGFRVYNDVPLISAFYPLMKWITG